MRITERVTRAIEIFWQLLTGVVMTAFALMLIIMVVQVISRYVLGIAVSWTDEASRYLFLTEIFLGSVLALRYQEHIRITIVTDVLSPSLRNTVAGVADVICVLVLLMLLVGAWNMMDRTAGIMASTFRMSFSYIYMIQFISALLMIGILFGDLYRRLTGGSLPTIENKRSH